MTKDKSPADEHAPVSVTLDFFHSGSRLTTTTTCRWSTPTDNLGKGSSELGTHCAIEDKVNSAVEKDRCIPDVAQRGIDIVKYTFVDAAEKRQKTSRQKTSQESYLIRQKTRVEFYRSQKYMYTFYTKRHLELW